VEFTGGSLCDVYWRQGFDSPVCICFNFNFFPLQELNYKTFSQRPLPLFCDSENIYFSSPNITLLVTDARFELP